MTTAVAEPETKQGELLFDRDVIVNETLRCRLTRSATEDGGEIIKARITDAWLWGNWAKDIGEEEPLDPDPADLAKACAAALGTEALEVDELQYLNDPEAIEVVLTRPATVTPAPAIDPDQDEDEEEDSEELSEFREMLSRIYAQRRRVQLAYNRAKAAKSAAKAAKDLWESERDQLEELIREAEEGGEAPLYQKPAKQPETAQAQQPAKEPEKPAEDDSWKKVELASLDLSESIVKKLADADLVTLGDLQLYQEEKAARGYGDPITQIKGVGAKAAEKISAALDEFWKKRGMAAPALPVAEKPAGPVAAQTDTVLPMTPPQPSTNGKA